MQSCLSCYSREYADTKYENEIFLAEAEKREGSRCVKAQTRKVSNNTFVAFTPVTNGFLCGRERRNLIRNLHFISFQLPTSLVSVLWVKSSKHLTLHLCLRNAKEEQNV